MERNMSCDCYVTVIVSAFINDSNKDVQSSCRFLCFLWQTTTWNCSESNECQFVHESMASEKKTTPWEIFNIIHVYQFQQMRLIQWDKSVGDFGGRSKISYKSLHLVLDFCTNLGRHTRSKVYKAISDNLCTRSWRAKKVLQAKYQKLERSASQQDRLYSSQ